MLGAFFAGASFGTDAFIGGAIAALVAFVSAEVIQIISDIRWHVSHRP